MLPCVCSVMHHIRRQNVESSSVTHSAVVWNRLNINKKVSWSRDMRRTVIPTFKTLFGQHLGIIQRKHSWWSQLCNSKPQVLWYSTHLDFLRGFCFDFVTEYNKGYHLVQLLNSFDPHTLYASCYVLLSLSEETEKQVNHKYFKWNSGLNNYNTSFQVSFKSKCLCSLLVNQFSVGPYDLFYGWWFYHYSHAKLGNLLTRVQANI